MVPCQWRRNRGIMSSMNNSVVKAAGKVPARVRAAFTLVELIVVVGIIGILSAILLSVTGSGTESARAAKCISNLRSLAQAANAYAMESGAYPAAGSYQHVGLSGNALVYVEVRGWISWLSNEGDPFGYEAGSAKPTSPVSVKVSTYDDKTNENRLFAITNGSIWKATACNFDVYRCPEHLRKDSKANFSYAMNSKFGYDYSKGTKGVKGGIGFGSLARADRMLMFAELDTSKSDEYSRDCTLQYKANVNGKQYGSNWDGTGESIAFVHKGSKNRKVAHVAFADGHTEKLLEPTGEGGLKIEDLTALLCEGKDVAFSGYTYEEVKATD